MGDSTRFLAALGTTLPVRGGRSKKAAPWAAFVLLAPRVNASARVILDDEVRLHHHRIGNLIEQRDAGELRRHLVVIDLDVVGHIAFLKPRRLDQMFRTGRPLFQKKVPRTKWPDPRKIRFPAYSAGSQDSPIQKP